ncbi:MAG: MFS transporter [Candidatus Rokuibacteriota bacterium]|nr:MAG: MFS transporter [Candidatus Rokubacteria bacterium]
MPPPPARASSPLVIALAGMVALAVPMGVGRFAFTPILPMMQVDAGLSIAAGAWLASANYLGTLIGALAATAVRVPIQPAVRGGLVTIGLATLAMGLERRVPAWIALRLIAGIATGWVLPFASAWALERLAPLRRPLLNAAVFAGFGVGIAAAGGVCIVLMHGRASSAQAWLSLGLVSLAATAVVWRSFVGRDVRSEASRRTGTGRCDTDAMLLVACYGSFGFGYIVPATFFPVMARAAIDDPSVFGWAWPVFGVTAAASTFAAAGLSRSLGNRRLWSLGHVVMAVGLVLPVIRPGIGSIMLSALLVGGTFTVITMAGFQEGREVGGVRMIAAMASAFAVGQIGGPVLVRYAVRADGGLSEALVIACAVLVAGAGVLALSRRSPPA